MNPSRSFLFRLSSSRSVSLTWLLLLIFLPSFSVSDVFTSTDKIIKAAIKEVSLLDHLQSYINDQHDKLKTMTNFLYNHTKKLQSMSQETLLNTAQHPNGAFTLIKHFVTTWQQIMHSNPTFLNKIDHIRSQLPTGNDLTRAYGALIRLQRVYLLRVEDMYVGNYSGHLGPPLQPIDTYFVGKQAFQDKNIKESIEWLELARDKMLEERERAEDKNYWSTWHTNAIALLGRAYVLMNRTDEAKELYAESVHSGRTNGDVRQLAIELKKQPKSNDELQVNVLLNNMTKLCSRDKNQRVAEIRSYHICRYKPSIYLPYLRFEEEILSIEPFASLFYNVISDQDGEMIKSFMGGKLPRGRIVPEGKGNLAKSRTSDVALLYDTDLEAALKLSKRIQAITWLDVSHQNSEAFQVVNYGIGGHYDAQMDAMEINENQQSCNLDPTCRLATFLIYLNDVEKGGHTVFLESGISVAPQKGMALFWYNFHPSLIIDYSTMHADCPVLIGGKWIVNKWILTYDNMFNRPCGPRPMSSQIDIEKLMYSRSRK